MVKTSSLGDIVHTLPALTDAARAVSGIRFDWVAEEAFTAVPAWHPSVAMVIPFALRRWRREIGRALRYGEPGAFLRRLRSSRYDCVIDAQGLLKSAWVTALAPGPGHGLDRSSAREPLASRFYKNGHHVPRNQHAVERVRTLFAAALGYPRPDSAPDYGIGYLVSPDSVRQHLRLVFLHGTTWASKHWPVDHWRELAGIAADQGYEVRLPWGSPVERKRAEHIADVSSRVSVLPSLSLSEIAAELAGSRGVVAVDSGLAHLSAAFSVPTVTVYGPTDPARTGVLGAMGINLSPEISCAPCLRRSCPIAEGADHRPPCLSALTPERVWRELSGVIARRGG